MAVYGEVEHAISEVVNLEYPVGPHATEFIVGEGEDVGGKNRRVFKELYDPTNTVHRQAMSTSPHFIVGRKGSGKTAFLLGSALSDDAEVALLRSAAIYSEVDRLRLRYEKENGPLVADNLAHVWEVLLYHAAMLQIARSDRLARSESRKRLWSYVSGFGDPRTLEYDGMFAKVGVALTARLLDGPPGLAFQEACWSIEVDGTSFAEARQHVEPALGPKGPEAVYVVVDNLEDLHNHLDAYSPVITGLFRLVGRSGAHGAKGIPFRMQFAFPAELLDRLSVLAANAEKDFRDRQTIRWTAAELIVIVGNRLRTFLDLYYPHAPAELGLPRQHDLGDRKAAEATLRALLPEWVTGDLGVREDPVAYLLRHTQLLPRQLIFMLNNVMKSAAANSSRALPVASPRDVVDGVANSEVEIVSGILSSYAYAFPKIGVALSMIKNHIALIEPASRLHEVFNHASVKRAGLDFDEFIDACFAVGALGIVSKGQTERYTQGDFSYTYVREIRPREDRDDVCVHPLFVSQLFDRHVIEEMSRAQYVPIYPYGSHPDHVDFDV
ncbi:MAG TPA: hypothetical protein VEB65_12995 [Solirubrobacterales bacterium]|nr:hypothetical protein [Solirubrobacterales bacterium]